MKEFQDFKNAVMESVLNGIELNEAVDTNVKQKILADYAKGNVLSKAEQTLIDNVLQKILKIRKSNFKIADKSTEKKLTWDDATKYVKTLGAGWRLPTIEELEEFYGSDNDFTKDAYWSSTEYSNKDYAWTKNFQSGVKMYYKKDLRMYVYVRAVKD